MFVYKLKFFTYKGLIGENGHSLGRTITLRGKGMLVELQCINGEYLRHNRNIPKGSKLVVSRTINTRLKSIFADVFAKL